MDEFRATVAELCGEPVLGDLQGRLVDSLIHRLAHGPAMSTADFATARRIAVVLGLAW